MGKEGVIVPCKALTCYLNEHIFVMGLIQKDKGMINYYLMSDKSAIIEYCFGFHLNKCSESEFFGFAMTIKRDYFPDYKELIDAAEK